MKRRITVKKEGMGYVVSGGYGFSDVRTQSKSRAQDVASARRRVVKKRKARLI